MSRRMKWCRAAAAGSSLEESSCPSCSNAPESQSRGVKCSRSPPPSPESAASRTHGTQRAAGAGRLGPKSFFPCTPNPGPLGLWRRRPDWTGRCLVPVLLGLGTTLNE
jgi:hypothetical protein